MSGRKLLAVPPPINFWGKIVLRKIALFNYYNIEKKNQLILEINY